MFPAPSTYDFSVTAFIKSSPSGVIRTLSSAVSQSPSVSPVKNLIPPLTDVDAERFKLLSLVPPSVFPHQTEAFSIPPSFLKIINGLSPSLLLSVSASM